MPRRGISGEEFDIRLQAIEEAKYGPKPLDVHWGKAAEPVNAWRREHDLEEIAPKSLYYWYRDHLRRVYLQAEHGGGIINLVRYLTRKEQQLKTDLEELSTAVRQLRQMVGV